MAEVKLIKTLPHLVPLHVNSEGVGLYASAYSPAIARYIMTAGFWAKDEITFEKAKQNLALLDTKGDVVRLWPYGYSNPLRLDFFGEELEKVVEYDATLGGSLRHLTGVYFSDVELDAADRKELHISNNDKSAARIIFTRFKPENVIPRVKYFEYDYIYPQLFWNRIDLLEKEILRLQDQDYSIKIVTKHPGRLARVLSRIKDSTEKKAEDSLFNQVTSDLPAGYISQKFKTAVFTDREIFGTIYLSQRKTSTTASQKLLQQLEGEISVGDFIVHETYGVGKYAGLTQEEVDGELREYLELQYADEAKLLVPVDQVHKLTRYIGNDGFSPTVNKLGKGGWDRLQTKVKGAVKIIARQLLEHYAKRQLASAPIISKEESPEYTKFLSEFPYQETEDQLKSTAEILHDLQKAIPMNRLLVGDVGFGKTEVMMRAAYRTVESGLQVAILCPTTVLAAQHYSVFTDRFKNTNARIENLSRFNTTKENSGFVNELNKGNIDIVIGTHRLLSNDVKFKTLGLLVVDEEQRFGVSQKEKIKKINYGVHFLSVSATPIPRTLSMALSSIQDISIITQAPPGRRPIQTKLIKDDWNSAVKAIDKEIQRGGQIYFVHNEVRSIYSIADKLQNLLPSIRIQIAHGQMPPRQLNESMINFYKRKSDVLLCTTIIENGLDMENVNTIIIHRAQRFGLSQLYQLRGRVGRKDRQAYCYLFYEGRKQDDELNQEEKTKILYLERLQALVDASDLGSGFHVASRDLEIRGAGDILGEKQHGNISKVGYALFMQLLADEIEKQKSLL